MTELKQACINNDGLSPDILKSDKEKLFDTCPLCSDQFNQQCIPNLMKCGHLMCNLCINEGTPFCGICNKNTTVKIAKYTKLFKVQETMATDKTKKYNLNLVNIDSSSSENYNNLTVDKTLKEIFANSLLFQAQINFDGTNKWNQNELNLIIGSKNFRYSQWKNKTLGDVILKGVKLKQASSNICNRATISNRQRGGNIC